MKKSDYYALVSFIVIAPHLWPGVALLIAIGALSIAGVSAVREYRGLPD